VSSPLVKADDYQVDAAHDPRLTGSAFGDSWPRAAPASLAADLQPSVDTGVLPGTVALTNPATASLHSVGGIAAHRQRIEHRLHTQPLAAGGKSSVCATGCLIFRGRRRDLPGLAGDFLAVRSRRSFLRPALTRWAAGQP
jgi:hypothetical protein